MGSIGTTTASRDTRESAAKRTRCLPPMMRTVVLGLTHDQKSQDREPLWNSERIRWSEAETPRPDC